jgi:hypothetical protein
MTWVGATFRVLEIKMYKLQMQIGLQKKEFVSRSFTSTRPFVRHRVALWLLANIHTDGR